MHNGSLEAGRIIKAFEQNVPDCYVRDYRNAGGYVTVCRGYKDIPWNDQADAGPVYRQVPIHTLCSLPQGWVTAAGLYAGHALLRPGWRWEFRKSSTYLTHQQKKAITKALGVGEVFLGVN